MAFSCSICLSIIEASSDIFCLPCGHLYHMTCTMQWFERTQSCPQCRKPTTEKKCIKVFPHTSEQGTQQDAGRLMQTIDGLNLEIHKLKKTQHEGQAALNKLNSDIKELKQENEEMSAEMSRLTSINTLLKKQAKQLKNVDIELQIARKAKEKAEQDLMVWRNVSKVVDGTLSEADEALRASANCSDINSVLTMCHSLKRELMASKNKLLHLKKNQELEKLNSKLKLAELEKQHKKEVELLNSHISDLEKEIVQKSKRLQAKEVESEREDLLLGRFLSELDGSSSNSQASGSSQSSVATGKSSSGTLKVAPSNQLKASNTNKVKVALRKPGDIFGVSRLSGGSGQFGLMKRMYENAASLPDNLTYDGLGRTVRAESGFRSRPAPSVVKKPKF